MRSERHSLLPLGILPLTALSAMLLGGCLEPFQRPTAPPKKSPKGTQKTAAPAKDKKKKKKKQSYKEAWRRICHAERLSGVTPDTPRTKRASLVSEWIAANVTNKKARYWWIGYSKVKKPQREAYLRAEAKHAGQATCPLTKLLFAKTPASAPRQPAARPTSKAPTAPTSKTPTPKKGQP